MGRKNASRRMRGWTWLTTGFWMLTLLGGAAACRLAAEAPAPAADPESATGQEAGPEAAAMALVPGSSAVVPGQPFTIGVELTVPAGWHTYWRNPGETGLAPTFAWRLPPGVRPLRVDYPVPLRFEEEGIVSFGYKGVVRCLAVFEADATLTPGEMTLGLDLTWMICRELCLPIQSSAEVTLQAASLTTEAVEDTRTAAWRERLPRTTEGWKVQARALAGGLRLRVAPTVDQRSPAYATWPDLKVFPERAGAVALARVANWERDGDAWATILASGEASYAPGEAFEAVLASGRAGDWTGWRIAAVVEPPETAAP